MKAILILLTLLAPLSVWADFPVPAYPDFPAISVQNGWKYTIYWKRGERMEDWEYSDKETHVIIFHWNEDGIVSQLKVTDPPQSFMHWLFIDSDADGYFDQGVGKGELKKKIKVPKIQLPDISYAESAKTIRDFIKGEAKFDYSDRKLRSATFKYFNDYPLKGEAWVYRYSKTLPSGRNDILHILHFADGQIFEFHHRP